MVMPGVSGGTGRVSTLRIAATSMDNIAVSEGEGQAERAPSRLIWRWSAYGVAGRRRLRSGGSACAEVGPGGGRTDLATAAWLVV
jgi:hypothetical protein